MNPPSEPLQEKPQGDSGRYGGMSREARRSGRRQRFIAAGVRIFGTQGYAAATTRGLCAEAGLTQRYFYESFADSEDLFMAIVRHLGAQIQRDILAAVATARGQPLQQLRGAVTAYLQGIHDAHTGRILLVEIYSVGTRSEPVIRRFIDDLTRLVCSALGEAFPALTTGGTKLSLLATAFIGAVHHLALHWVLHDYAEPMEALVTTALQIFTGPLRELELL